MKVGAQKCVTQRVRNSAGSVTSRGLKPLAPKKSRVWIQGHERHDEAAQDVNGNDASRSGAVCSNASGRGSCRHFNLLSGALLLHRGFPPIGTPAASSFLWPKLGKLA